MSASVVFVDVAHDFRHMGTMAVVDGEAVCIEGDLDQGILDYVVITRDGDITSEDGDLWLQEVARRFKGYVWAVYVPDPESTEEARDFDPAKHPKWPKGTEGGKGGRWMPKGAGQAMSPADFPELGYPDYDDDDDDVWEATAAPGLEPYRMGADGLKDSVVRDLSETIEQAYGLDWMADAAAGMELPGSPNEKTMAEVVVDGPWRYVNREQVAAWWGAHGELLASASDDDKRAFLREWTSSVLQTWAHGGRTFDIAFLRRAASLEFGIGLLPDLDEFSGLGVEVFHNDLGDLDDSSGDIPKSYWTDDRRGHPAMPFARMLLRAMYDTTQKRLAAAGYKPTDTVTLRRGLTGEPLTSIGRTRIVSAPASSWSHDRASAKEFAPTDVGYMVTSEVPLGRILSTPYTGMGCWSEGEWVVLGANGKANVERYDYDYEDGEPYATEVEGYLAETPLQALTRAWTEEEKAKHPHYPAGTIVNGENVGGDFAPKNATIVNDAEKLTTSLLTGAVSSIGALAEGTYNNRACFRALVGGIDAFVKVEAFLARPGDPEWGARPGLMPDGDDVNRQMAAQEVNMMLDGLVNMPVCVIRNVPVEGKMKKALVMQWVDGSRPSPYIGADEPERIEDLALFDAVIGNADSHQGNVKQGSDGTLYPIDAGFTFPKPYHPRRLASDGYVIWGDWAGNTWSLGFISEDYAADEWTRPKMLPDSDKYRFYLGKTFSERHWRALVLFKDTMLYGNGRERLKKYLNKREIDEVMRRVNYMLRTGRFLSEDDFAWRTWAHERVDV